MDMIKKGFISATLLTIFLPKYPWPASAAIKLAVFNDCPFTVWPVLRGINSSSLLMAGQSRVYDAPTSWIGRVWGRTNCSSSPESLSNFVCTTGDCSTRRLDCSDTSPREPVTLMEFNLNPDQNVAYYDISLVNGFNLPALILPHGGSNCSSTGCTADLNKLCPAEQRFESSERKVVGCHNTNNSVPIFKEACPRVYSTPLDVAIAAFECRGVTNFDITFCPSDNASLRKNPLAQSPLPPSVPPLSGPNPPSPLPAPPFSSPSALTGKRRHIRIIVIVASAAAVVLVLAIVLFIVRRIKRGSAEKDLHEWLTLDGYTENHGVQTRGAENNNLRLFTYESIVSATNNFSLNNKLGEGGFGSVYKGQTLGGQAIAVKVLSQQSGQGLVEFKTELILISKLQHVNLVKLHGFCIHGEDKMIIYDYLPNKSLDFFLFSPTREVRLNWQQRFNIIEGIAQGLLYLHKYSRLKIIHRDLKPSNILLDENMNAKISDFGLARVFEHNIDEANTNRRVGTFGYMAPEYAMQGMFSVKSDVYSFGVLVLEIVSGRKNNCFKQMEGPLNLVEHAWDLWKNDSALQLMDSTLTSSCNVEQLQRCIHIGILCVENRAVDRPTIEDVLLMLKSETTSLPRPVNPSFIARNHVVEEVNTKLVTSKSSINEITRSDIGGR